MVIVSMLRHVLNDDESLSAYLKCQFPSIEDIRRRIFLRERSENRSIPDHHYRLVLKKNTATLDDMEDLMGRGIYNLAKEHLELRGTRIFVLQKKQNDWQQLVTYMPPLLLQATYLFYTNPLTSSDHKDIHTYFTRYVLPNTKYTALPYPFIPQLESYIKEKNGLHDLHMHLNGAMETDLVWQNFLAAPDRIYRYLSEAFSKPKVREQFEQESHLLHPLDFYRLLTIARRIRQVFFDFIFSTHQDAYKGHTADSLLAQLIDVSRDFGPGESFRHPFQHLVSGDDAYRHLMAVEGLMYILLLRYLENKPPTVIINLFHFYLLILGLANRLMVQQTHQYGFEQFQKHTLNGLREYSEQEYLLRFFQMHGNELRNIAFLEGRFSPQDSEIKCLALLYAIDRGWKNLEHHIKEAWLQVKPSCIVDQLPQLRLTAHFIKKEEKKPYGDIRHQALRIDTWKRAEVLAQILKNYPPLQERIVGIDAAASEFDTPPEVFATVFRMMRRKGIRHFTYHAGEDFHHIISGLRAIFEAVNFAHLQQGDRIGHAVATGIPVGLWVNTVGKHVLIRNGEWLDNLVFVYHLIISENIDPLKRILPNITNEMVNISQSIYGRYMTPGELENAWLLRRYCPFLLFSENRAAARRHAVYDDDEWCEIQRQTIHPDTVQILRLYHSDKLRAEYDRPIEIETISPLGEEDLKTLQLAMLKILHRKEIVIETLPTSNVRIGHHRDFSTYHLWRWFAWEAEGQPIPPIVVGTDDTGIFATSIYNEYANIYCHLTNSGKMTHNKAMQIIIRLDENSRVYRFE